MQNVIIREPTIDDKSAFIDAMQRSQPLHAPWVQAPITDEEFKEYFDHFKQPNQKSFLVCTPNGTIAGVT